MRPRPGFCPSLAILDDLFEYAIEMMGGIDLFFANAGFAYWERVQEPDWGRIEAIFETNVFSPIYALQKMHALQPGSDYRVVFTSSILGRVGLDGYALYSAPKAALDRFAEVYRLETGKSSRLVLAYPLAVRSRFFQRAGRAPIPWLSQSAEDAARAILRGIEKERETIYTSWILRPMLLVPGNTKTCPVPLGAPMARSSWPSPVIPDDGTRHSMQRWPASIGHPRGNWRTEGSQVMEDRRALATHRW